MRKLIVILVLCAAAASGCTTLTAPPPPIAVGPNGMTGYFWPDSNATYIYTSMGDSESVTISKAGNVMAVTTADLISKTLATVYDTITPGIASFNSLSASTFLQIPDSTILVSDTNQILIPAPIKIKAMVSSNGGGHGKPFAAELAFCALMR